MDVPDVNGVRILKDDQPIPPVLEKLREMKKTDAYESSGSGDALRGEKNPGVEAGYAFRILEEREQRRITHVRRELEYATGCAGEKLLACLRAQAAQMGPDIVGYMLRNAAGEFSAADVRAFIEAPMSFGVDVMVRSGSMQARSKATQQATLMDIVQKVPGAANRLNDADVFDRFMKEFDADTLRDFSSVDRDKARKENDVLIDITNYGPDALLPLPIVCENDLHDIHIPEHEAEYKKRFMELQTDEFALQAWNLHMEMHRFYQKQQRGDIPPGTMHNFRALAAQAGSTPADPLALTMQKGAALKDAKQQQQLQQPGAPGGQPPPGAPPNQSPGGRNPGAVARDSGAGMGGAA